MRSQAFVAAHPTCVDCGRPSQMADHNPTRAVLIAQGITDPDADQYLVPRCKPCHTRKTNREDGGGWPREQLA